MSEYRDSHGRHIVVKDQTYEGIDFYVSEDRVTERQIKSQIGGQPGSDEVIRHAADSLRKISLESDD